MIDFTHPTKFSRIASIVVFVGIVPAVSFYVGLEYMLTRYMVEAAELPALTSTGVPLPCEADES